MVTTGDDTLRGQLEGLLHSGLETEWKERAYTSDAVNEVIRRLQAIPADDYAGKVKVSGLMDHPYAAAGEDIKQACETCMYYGIHRQFCELPELHFPVKPEWSCRLWRV